MAVAGNWHSVAVQWERKNGKFTAVLLSQAVSRGYRIRIATPNQRPHLPVPTIGQRANTFPQTPVETQVEENLIRVTLPDGCFSEGGNDDV